MATALEIIEAAMSKLGLIGPGDTVSAEDADVSLKRLNALVDSWENEGILGYTHTITTFTLPANTTSRTIGPSLQINCARPTRIEPSFSRIDGIDAPLKPVDRFEYDKIAEKTYASTYPEVCFFDGGTPTGVVYFWPAVGSAVEVHLVTPETGGIATLVTDYVFPPGYQRALENGLAIEIAPDFGVNLTPFLISTAASSKRLIRRQNLRVPQLDFENHGRRYIVDDWVHG